VDIGGSKIAAGAVTDTGGVQERLVVPTPHEDGAEGLVSTVVELIDRLRKRHPHVRCVGVGAAGLVDPGAGCIRWAPNNTYRDLPLRDILSDATDLPVVVDNDANAAAWAEATIGAGVGLTDLAVFTVGTGVGAGLILGGRLHRGRGGLAGEVGHLIVDRTGGVCGCGMVGCLEAEASGTALARQANALTGHTSGDPLTGADGITGRSLLAAAAAGDPAARALFERMGERLGWAIASVVTLLDLQLVVLGGGLVAAEQYFLDNARASARRDLFSANRREVPPIECGQLGPDAGMIGAALLAVHDMVAPAT
jgi:glucokinase